MTYTETHKVTLIKPAQRQLQDKVVNNNLSDLLESVQTKALSVRGWTVAGDPSAKEYQAWGQSKSNAWERISAYRTTDYRGYEHVYKMYLSISYYREDGKTPEPNELGSILRTIAVRVTQPKFGKWTLKEVDGAEYVLPDTEGASYSTDDIGYAPVEMPADWDSHFSHLFGLDPHITRIRRALEAGIMSGWNNRYHCALVGPPGCGKSDISQSIKRALGEDAVLEFDATATTAAGAIKELSEREILPRILIVEEIEKADQKAMQFLLSVLDLRSQIRKTTARNTIVRDTKLFAIATVNDVPLFQSLQAGALASRFSNTITFKRPSREQLRMILEREVEKVGGNPLWINPTLDYCDKANINDPRSVTAHCMCGRDMLLTGEYEAMMEATTSEREEP